jgi:ribonucleoside-triphosphate reductase (formate)
MKNSISTRAQVITRRTYNRPLNDEGTEFETWSQTVSRVIGHQKWLWKRAQGELLDIAQLAELEELRQLMMDRKALPSGRTLWLGGTSVAMTREASQFNCSFGRVETVHDVVDAFWLLLQGCGVGFEPIVGNLNGFTRKMEVEVLRSTREDRGIENNQEEFDGNVWTIVVGDSAESWAKAAGKLLAGKWPAKKLVLDFRQIRPGGQRLRGYGWISSGDSTVSVAFERIAGILNRQHGKLLGRLDILDVMNWLGTTLSSRRSAEIALMPFGSPEWSEFAMAKKEFWVNNPQRAQSNNSLVFYNKPSKADLNDIFKLMMDAGGSEPGFINGQAALKRAPWFKGVNPCAEILLGNKSFCNLVEVDLAKFNGDRKGLNRAVYLIARANYRQTCVNLDDGVLQRSWHELNEFLRLTGVGLTGIVRWEHLGDPKAFEGLRFMANLGATEMADELGLPRSKAVTTVKPSGTLSKIMDTTEGVHKPLGKYILNNVNFSSHDPLVPVLERAGYRVFDNPFDSSAKLVTFPVAYHDVKFDNVDGKEVNLESAVDQLERYKMLMNHYVQHNCSITVSYSPDEVPAIINWIYENWDSYVGVSFLYRNDPTKTAADLGYLYLPQEVVTEETYVDYASKLSPVDVEASSSFEEIKDEGCATGACPIR